jgi:hypothetical protein
MSATAPSILKDDSIGTVQINGVQKHYIIKKGKPIYITMNKYYELVDMNKYEINQPLYTEIKP